MHFITRFSLFTALLLFSAASFCQNYSIIPYPKEVKEIEGEFFRFHSSSRILYSEDELSNEANYLQRFLKTSTGFELPTSTNNRKLKKGDIVLITENSKGLPAEGYRLKVENGVIKISAPSPAGIFYGLQTLLQLMPTESYAATIHHNTVWSIPAVEINDEPTFEWRGMHMDVARHFHSVDFVKKFIDLMAYHKMNTFHWHLTEDQGWRIEIKKYPKLTEIGAWRDSTLIGHMRDKPAKYKVERYGGFYTQEQIREVVKYAGERHITIVPEIEMPGHAQAAVAAYPKYGCTGTSPGLRPKWGISEQIFNPEEKTIDFLKDVLDEVMDLFPGEYIHIGGDEAKKNLWESSERIQQLKDERGLKDMHEMQSWFIRQIDEYLASKGRKLIGWDEILEGGLAENAAVMSWRGDKGGIKAAKMGHKVVMANNKYTYFDKYQSQKKELEPLAIGGYIPLEKVYNFNPVPDALTTTESKYILGAQAQLWSEYIPTSEHMEYMAFPRLCALSEVVWSNSEDRNYHKFLEALKVHLQRLEYLNVNYRLPDEFRENNIAKVEKELEISSFSLSRREQGEQGVSQIIGLVSVLNPSNSTLKYNYNIISGGGKIEVIDSSSFVYVEDQPGEVVISVLVTDNIGNKITKSASFTITDINYQDLYDKKVVWETYLESNFPKGLKHPAFHFVEKDTSLPDVLIMGNSISIGYTNNVRKELEGIANVYRIPENGGDTRAMLKKHDVWLAHKDWDVIHFNWGLHDLKRLADNQLDASGERNVSLEEYKTNMKQIIDILDKTGARLIFATTSVVPEGAKGRISGDEVLYNDAVLSLLKAYPQIFVDDQFTLTKQFPDEQNPANVHFKTEGKERQGNQVAEKIKEVINNP